MVAGSRIELLWSDLWNLIGHLDRQRYLENVIYCNVNSVQGIIVTRNSVMLTSFDSISCVKTILFIFNFGYQADLFHVNLCSNKIFITIIFHMDSLFYYNRQNIFVNWSPLPDMHRSIWVTNPVHRYLCLEGKKYHLIRYAGSNRKAFVGYLPLVNIKKIVGSVTYHPFCTGSCLRLT